MLPPIRLLPFLLAALGTPAAVQGQAAPWITIRAPVLVLRHARVVDGTGAPARDGQSLLIRDGRIEAVGPDRSVPVPAGADTLDLSGRTVLPGLVMMHEHLFYPTGPVSYAWSGFTFARLLLAAGVTTARTAGAINPYADLALRGMIASGQVPGPDLFLTGPVMEGPGLTLPGIRVITDTADARRAAALWAAEGMHELKLYNRIDSATAAVIIGEAHARGIKVAGHVCALGLREAAALRIDALEHGLFAASDFDPTRRPGTCSPNQIGSLARLAPDDPRIADLARALARSGVAVTSTLPVFETYLPGRGTPDSVVALLLPQLAEAYRTQRARVDADTSGRAERVWRAGLAFERQFFRAGGLLLVGTDPTGRGGVIPGYADTRAVELLVEAGLTPLEAITVATRNGARYLGREREIGTVEAGKQADLLVVRGDPSQSIGALGAVQLVFKRGVGYDPARLVAGLQGTVGLR